MTDYCLAYWTFERTQKLRELWSDRTKSASDIAVILGGGATRSAIIGKAHRLKLERRGESRGHYAWRAKMGLPVPDRVKANVPPPPRVKKVEPVASTPSLAPTPAPKAKLELVPVAVVVAPVPVSYAPASLMERTGCCFPLGDDKATQTYCNAPLAHHAPGGMWQYCEAHKALMFAGRSFVSQKRRHAAFSLGSVS